MRLDGQVAIVTGSSRGIGRATAALFAAEGATVVVNCRERVEEARTVVGAIGPERALLVQADVSRAAEARRLVDETVAAFGRVDVLVNNAGAIFREAHWSSDVETWHATLDANLASAWLMAREVAPVMLDQGRGAIVNVASIYGSLGAASDLSYSVAKGGVLTMTKALAKELAPAVRVNAVSPGNVLTDMTREGGPELCAAFERETPLRRSAAPEEIARVALFLASSDASFVTGETVVADGGFSLR